MTKEEAIELIDDRMCFGRGKWSKHHEPEIDEYWQAGKMAIEALRAQDVHNTNVGNNGDTIYRQDAIDGADEIIKRDTSGNNAVVEAMKAWKVYIGNLPSAQPERKTGRWIEYIPEHGKCPFCGNQVDFMNDKENNFCGECGADMRGAE